MENYTIAEYFTLPSHGLVYDTEINPNIKLRSMTVRDEMRRTAPSSDGSIYKTMADIIDSCMIENPGISSYDMCIGDYQFLLHKLRIVSLGSQYKIECRCPVCGDKDEHIINLDSLELTELQEFDKDEFLKVKLPVSGKEIELNITTPRILDNIEKDVLKTMKTYKKQNKNASELDWHLLYQLIHAIKTVDGEKLSFSKKENFCNSLVSKDFNTIINALRKMEEKVGLGDIVEIHCNNCGYDIPTTFRITSEFFRPTTTSEE